VVTSAKMKRPSFFAELGRMAGSRQRENQLSRTFAACFNESQGFRRQMVGVFWKATGHSGHAPGHDHWQCVAEESTPMPGGGRVDLHITRTDGRGRTPPWHHAFYVESKVESRLTRRQPHNYGQHGVRPLIVITKYRPEVPAAELKAEDVFSRRWQDVHRALQDPGIHGAVDRRICRWMTDYLEELDMAYREDLSLADLDSCGTLFRIVTSKREWSAMASRGVFAAAHSCTGVLDDLHQDFLGRHPKLASAPYQNRQTFCGTYTAPSGKSVTLHHLGWSISKTRWTKWQLICSICWRSDHAGTNFYVRLEGSAVEEHESFIPVDRFLSKGKLDRGKLLRHLEVCSRRWGVV
jgi:hypothetical protein